MSKQLGAQMYTLRDHLQSVSDAARTCARVKTMGYNAIQVSAFGKDVPVEDIAKICDDEGLTVAATHVPFDKMKDTKACVEYHQILKCQYTALGGFGFGGASEENWTAFAADFSRVASELKAAGVHVGYHNHSHEWARLEEGNPASPRAIDLLTEKLGKDTWFELDTYWVAHAGGDPAYWIRRIHQLGPDRIPCVHVKDMSITAARGQKMCEVGDGNLNWEGIIAACRDAGVRWYLVERDSGDLDPFDSLKRSYDNLVAMGL